MAGYSPTPLIKKLGIKPGFLITTIDEPDSYFDWLGTLPDEVDYTPLEEGDHFHFIHLFVKEQSRLDRFLPGLKNKLRKDGMLWISWPKKAAKMSTDLDGNMIRSQGLEQGLVDTKVCAVSPVWSGLKFMYRKKDR